MLGRFRAGDLPRAPKEPPVTDLRFVSRVKDATDGAELVVLAAPKSWLDQGWLKKVLGEKEGKLLDRAAEDAKPGDNGGAAGTYGGEGGPRRYTVIALPDKVSRHNSPSRSEALRATLENCRLNGQRSAVLVGIDDASHVAAVAATVARALPLFSMQSKKSADGKAKAKKPAPCAAVATLSKDGAVIAPAADTADLADAVRMASRLVDTPPDLMRTSHFEQEARKAVKGLKNVTVRSIVGDDLLKHGMGGLHAVGRAASVAPRLVVLEYAPKKPRRTVALVGKGLIYDTGGLDIKVGGGMQSMKCDMGGAAAVLGAFLVLARSGCKDRVVALCCMAENAVGPESYRSDDILTAHSGKTIEVNNTDAEGRIVLADGLSYAARDLKADFIVDIATLTGAARICTGDATSCTVSNRGGVEALSVECGRRTGDLTFPLLWLPEMLKSEFASKVADMTNSVKSRMNAQSSAAAVFLHNHIEDTGKPWLHLDVAGPAFRNGRGTGHGVPLMVEIVRNLTDAHLAE
ncbi:MAG: cytosol aminopeptidase [Planctomycetes bacterium]|nr:cytosol aminopeptidase [Planctomycetota bacterium]